MQNVTDRYARHDERGAHMFTCAHCGMRYDWRRSPSASLKMTYCGALCEQANLGFTIEAFLRYEVPKRPLINADQVLSDIIAAMADDDADIDAEGLVGLIAA